MNKSDEKEESPHFHCRVGIMVNQHMFIIE